MAYDENYDPISVKARRDELIGKIADGLLENAKLWYQNYHYKRMKTHRRHEVAVYCVMFY